MRIISEQTGVPSQQLRSGNVSGPDLEMVVGKARELKGLPLYIDDTGGLGIGQLAARARRIKRQRGINLLVVDYLQLMHGSKKRGNDNRVQEVTEITTGLKALAKELKIPILALSQLSRQVESRDEKRPQLSDLRESGSIEQDADAVLFIYRAEYYHQMIRPPESDVDKHASWMVTAEKLAGIAEIIIGKHRHGPTGTVDIHFNAETTSFSNLATHHRMPERVQ